MATTTSTSTANIPLTTQFVPPSSCESVHWVSSDCQLSTCLGIYNIVRDTATDCYPSGWAKTATTFSPGLICPSGYSIALQSSSVLGAALTETYGTCCPSGFEVVTENREAWYSLEPCVMTSHDPTAITYTVLGVTPTTTTTITYSTPIIHAIPVGLVWQSSDLSSASTAALTAASTAASTDASTAASTAASATTNTAVATSSLSDSAADSSAGSNSGLTTGAKAGVGVGVSIGVILIAVLCWIGFCVRRKRNQNPTPPGEDLPIRHHNDVPAELPGTSPTDWSVELSGDYTKKHELHSP
ncbi:hypothetical protein N7462_001904 [Penicillium macrosclerotiorum]|uniref:uncharacterized protein n=1 Tax=Penicillium macrosclerotiorum TaxID=303699 RepID=UPI002547ED6E|nr:uncharacterized protein N7462_001904 [Penicillium macrosclerotiorum]KAJ5692481.1 hypothetical protein N7462_001904 [Penicillium macrosclerotiorum]